MKIAPASAVPSRRVPPPSPAALPRRPVTPPSARSVFTAARAGAFAARPAPARAAPSRGTAPTPPPAPAPVAPEPSPQPGFHDAVTAFKRQLIESTLTALGGNRTRTARALKLQRTYLLRLMREFSVDVPAPSIAPRRATIAPTASPDPRGR